MKGHACLAMLVLAAVSCGPVSGGLKPIGAADAQTACPGGRRAWNLQLTDLRANRGDSERVFDLVRQSLARSFPGCQWPRTPVADTPTIAIEIHRLAADFDGSMYDGIAEWTVAARSGSGQTLTEFEADARAERPNYRSSNNEKEVLQAAFEQAMQRTVTGLRNLPEVP